MGHVIPLCYDSASKVIARNSHLCGSALDQAYYLRVGRALFPTGPLFAPDLAEFNHID